MASYEATDSYAVEVKFAKLDATLARGTKGNVMEIGHAMCVRDETRNVFHLSLLTGM